MLAVARIAAVQAVKKTSDLIPLAHGGVPVEGCIVRVEPLGHASLDTEPKDSDPLWKEQTIEEGTHLFEPIGMYGGVRISVQVETTAKTGVEMEALTGVVGAALTIVDMCKGVDKGCVVDDVRVVGKKGGRSGGLGIWRERLEGSLRETRRAAGKGPTQSMDESLESLESVEKEDVVERTDNERTGMAKIWKRWTQRSGKV